MNFFKTIDEKENFDEFYQKSSTKELINYINKLNALSIMFENEKYFTSQRRYEKVPAVDSQTARLLYFIALMKKPSNILEIGFGSGFSAYSLYCGALNNIRHFITYEHEKKRFTRGKKYIESKKINIEIIFDDFSEQSIKKLMEKEKIAAFDLVFIDGVKREYPVYFDQVKKIICRDSILMFDNILFNGKLLMLNKKKDGKNTEGAKILYSFNENLAKDKEFSTLFLPVGDGIAICIKN